MSTPKKRKITSGSTALTNWLGKSQLAMETQTVETNDNPVNKTPSKIRKSGVDPKWNKEFPWLIITEDQQGMLCSLCKKFRTRSQNGGDTWINTPCTYIIKESLKRHARSSNHINVVDLEANSRLAERGQGIEAAVVKHVSMERTALVGAFKCLFWLAKEEIAHTTHYGSLLDLAKSMGCDYLNMLMKGDNVNYRSHRIMQEMLECISAQIRKPILTMIRDSLYFSILIDETTDIAVLKQMTIMARFMTPEMKVRTAFLGLVDLPDGKADTIMAALETFFRENELPLNKLIGMGSDGASVMVGRKTGVATQLKTVNPELINIHCVAHRLALASAQATDNIPYLRKFKDIMQQLFRFYQNSAVRMSGLKEIEAVFGGASFKLKEISDTRWLSHEMAVTAVRRCLPSLITSLEREAADRNDATAAGLATFCKDPRFLCTIYMLSDVLPHLCRLSKVFQKAQVDFTLVDPMVSSTQMTLLRMMENPGEFFSDLPNQLESLKESDITAYKEGVFQKYLDNVVNNLHERFPDNNILEALTIFDPELMDKGDPTFYETVHFQKLQVLAGHFKSITCYETVKEEFLSFRFLLAKEMMQDMTFQESLLKVATMEDLYPSLARYAQIALVLPMSTADCERSFSTMNRVKTNLRNRLSQNILNSLMTISIEGQSLGEFDFDSCVKFFGQLKKRKISS